MLTATSCRIFAALFYMVLTTASSGALAQEGTVRWLSVDMPHGGCSLTAQQDGSASIHFGAMPRWIHVAPGTFGFEELVKLLRAKSFPQSSRETTGPQVGSLLLPGSQDLLFIDDRETVSSLLERAWRAQVHPITPHEIEDYAWVSKACSLL